MTIWMMAEAVDKGKEDGISLFMRMPPGGGGLSSRLSRQQRSGSRGGGAGGLLDFPALPSLRAATDAPPVSPAAGPAPVESRFPALSLQGDKPRSDLVPQPSFSPNARGRKLSRRCACLALVLHLLIGGMVLAYARHVSLLPGASAGGGGGESGLVVLGRVCLGAPAGALSSPPASGPAGEAALKAPPLEADASAAGISPRQTEKADRVQPEEKAVPILASSPAKPAETRSRPASPRRAARAAPSGQGAAGETKPGGHPSAAPAGDRNGSQPGGLAQGSPAASGAGTGASSGASPEGTGHVPFGGKNGPSFKYFARPEYPAQARRQGITGEVLLRILVNADGKAERIEVRKSAHDALTRAAREAVLRSTFHPLLRDGAPAPCWTLLPVTFTLERG